MQAVHETSAHSFLLIAPSWGAYVMNQMNKMVCQAAAILFLLLLGFQCVQAGDYFVDASSMEPTPPFTNWATAALRIQDAVDVAITGSTVWVRGGIYDKGSRATPGATLQNRLVVTNDINVCAPDGPDTTLIEGAPDPTSGNLGSNAVRCVYIAAGRLTGFTLTNGYTQSTGDLVLDQSGGAVHAVGATISNCFISGNRAAREGGGVYGGTVQSSRIIANCARTGGGLALVNATGSVIQANKATVIGGGASESDLNACEVRGNTAVFGGGVSQGRHVRCQVLANSATNEAGGGIAGMFVNCTIASNTSYLGGGTLTSSLFGCRVFGNSASIGAGANEGFATNCLFFLNTAAFAGGGAANTHLLHCTVAGNVATNSGGGAYVCTVENSIVYDNVAPEGANIWTGACLYSCTYPDPGGTGNITNSPAFVNPSEGDFHLQRNSPCVDASPTNGLTFDFDATPRPLDGDGDGEPKPDVGAYEFKRHHSADYRAPSWALDGTEMNRVLAYWRAGAYRIESLGSDGYAPTNRPGLGNTNGIRHSADYRPPYWTLDVTEVNRVLSYWQAGGYVVDAKELDGYAPTNAP